MSPFTRRQLLQLAAATGAGAGLAAFTGPHHALAADEFDTLRQRWADAMILGTGFDAAAEPYKTKLSIIGTNASNNWTAMSPSTSALWPELPIGSVSANVTGSFGRLHGMAAAYLLPNTGLTGNAELLADILTGLDWMHSHAYTPATTMYGNWWDWQIGSPKTLLNLMALLYPHLSGGKIGNFLAAIDHFVTDSFVTGYSPPSVGANRVDFCQIFVLHGIVGKNAAKIAQGRDALAPVFPLVRNGEGFYADGSYIAHTKVPYIGTYGQVFIGGIAGLMALLAGSSWAITDPNRQVVFDAVTNAIAPFMFNGLMMNGQSGRAISRGINPLDPYQTQHDDHTRGHALIGSILLLADGAPSTQAAQWRQMAKGWMQRDYWSPYLNDRTLGIPALARGQAILGDAAIGATAEPAGSQIFGSMDRATHRRATWAFALALCSARTTFYETGNGENLRGWHTNSGMTYWWGDTYGNGQYSDAYWPTVDPYRLPGTTVSRKPLADAEGGQFARPSPSGIWVGGATDGTYSAIGQDTRGLASTLKAKKSWFCLADQVVCLGSGISASDGYPVETTIDNRNLGPSAANHLHVDGAAQPTTQGWSATFTGASWATIGGFGGYIFPGGATFKALRQERTGAWSDIGTGNATTPITRRYMTMWFDHGTNPSSGSYAYILLPGASASITAARADTPTVSVLANTATAQAITDSATGVTAANFFAAATAGPITVSAPCSVLMRESGNTLSVSIADPTRNATTITVTIDRHGYTTATGDHRISVTGLDPIKLVAEVGGGQGASRTITFGTGQAVTAAQATFLSPLADTYVRDGSYAATNYGSGTTLAVKNSTPGFNRKSFLKFDLSGLTAAPQRAVLWVYAATTDGSGTQSNIDVYPLSHDSWTETGLTWNNQPALGSPAASIPIGSVKDWIPIEVSAAVAAQYATDKTVTIALGQAAPGLLITINSRNNAGGQPILEIITGQ